MATSSSIVKMSQHCEQEARVLFVNKLQRLLALNYAALGFTLLNVELGSYEVTHDAFPLRGHIRCPCGTEEYFHTMLDMHEGKNIHDVGSMVDKVAYTVLQNTASIEHLKQGIADGTLPSDFDIAAHAFTGLLR